jgi:hypothetical protein
MPRVMQFTKLTYNTNQLRMQIRKHIERLRHKDLLDIKILRGNLSIFHTLINISTVLAFTL